MHYVASHFAFIHQATSRELYFYLAAHLSYLRSCSHQHFISILGSRMFWDKIIFSNMNLMKSLFLHLSVSQYLHVSRAKRSSSTHSVRRNAAPFRQLCRTFYFLFQMIFFSTVGRYSENLSCIHSSVWRVCMYRKIQIHHETCFNNLSRIMLVKSFLSTMLSVRLLTQFA